jgi:hypothetical protein
MDEHWPALEKAEFYPTKGIRLMKSNFQWLMNERKESGKPLVLSVSLLQMSVLI